MCLYISSTVFAVTHKKNANITQDFKKSHDYENGS